ncbi:MAG: hypothetical protein GY795_01960 [Desulfobacterales bacterium]|nr:hypothetical protein [Desulfobacterales bacterium]
MRKSFFFLSSAQLSGMNILRVGLDTLAAQTAQKPLPESFCEGRGAVTKASR